MAIHAVYFNSRSRFVIEHTVAMRVLPEMTIDAVHAFLKMNVVEVHCLLESIRIVGRNDRVLGIQQVAFSIAFENLAKHPAVTVRICELRPLELAVELR